MTDYASLLGRELVCEDIKQQKPIHFPLFYLCIAFLIFAILSIGFYQNMRIRTLKWEITNITSLIKNRDATLALLKSEYAKKNSHVIVLSRLNKLGMKPGNVQIIYR
ncbi:MAG: hypothetical protein J7J16_05700 [Deltaproteobacteria bacterium]|nr:hypothetical protein [Deltaproteobacteria bacterium]